MKKLLSIITVLFAIIAISLTSCERIDAGHVGIKVNLYGDNKGVDDVTAVTGMVFYNFMSTQIYEFPTFMQTKDYEPFSVNAKDASQFEVDPKLNYFVDAEKVPSIFKKYRKPLADIENGFLKIAVYDAYRIVASQMTSDEIMSNRGVFEDKIQKQLADIMTKEGFMFDQLTSAIEPPSSLRDAINSKNKAIQDALQAENKVKQAEAEAKIKVAQAEGVAKEMAIKGDAEAEYNRKVSASLSSILVQQQMIKAWDGKLPVYGTVPQLFRDVSK